LGGGGTGVGEGGAAATSQKNQIEKIPFGKNQKEKKKRLPEKHSP